MDWLGGFRAVLGAGDWRWRVIGGVVLVLVAMLFELATGTFYYATMDHRIALLKELQQLSTSDVAADPRLGPIYQDLVTQLSAGSTFAYRPLSPLKFLAGGFVGLVMLAISLWRIYRGRPERYWKVGLFVGVFFTVFLGLIGALIPDVGAPWVNASLYVLIALVAAAVGGAPDSVRGTKPH